MSHNNNHHNLNVNPLDSKNERGSILKPLLLVLALLAMSVSLTYAMVVTKASGTPATPKKEKENHYITLDNNPVAYGDPVVISVRNVEAGDKDFKVYVHFGATPPDEKDKPGSNDEVVSGTLDTKKHIWKGTTRHIIQALTG